MDKYPYEVSKDEFEAQMKSGVHPYSHVYHTVNYPPTWLGWIQYVESLGFGYTISIEPNGEQSMIILGKGN